MGANFCTMSVPADLSRDVIAARFKATQEDDRYRNGHEYSGGFGMATGLRFLNETFPDRDAAERFLEERCEKWEDALAVKHKTIDGTERWLIGAWCAS